MLLVFSLAHSRDNWNAMCLLLTRIIVATSWGTIISFILAISLERDLHGMLFWLMGDLSHAPLPL